jgi:dephospho-CoA kinase
MQRLIMRDNLTQTDAQDRVAAQLPLIDKVQYADRVIDNSGGLQELARQVDAVVAALRRKAGWSWRLAWWFPPLAVVMGLWRISERIVRFALFRRGIGVSRTQS